jgi:hypothetical protein
MTDQPFYAPEADPQTVSRAPRLDSVHLGRLVAGGKSLARAEL